MKTIIFILVFYSSFFYGQRKTTLILKDEKNKKISLNDFNDNILLERNKYGIKLFEKTTFYRGNIDDYYCISRLFVHSKVMLEDLKFSPKDSLFSNLFFLKVSNRKLIDNNTEWSFIENKKMVLTQSNLSKFYHYNQLDSYGAIFKTINQYLGLENVKYLIAINLVYPEVQLIVTKKEEIYVYLENDDKIMTLSEFSEFYESGGIKRFRDNYFERM